MILGVSYDIFLHNRNVFGVGFPADSPWRRPCLAALDMGLINKYYDLLLREIVWLKTIVSTWRKRLLIVFPAATVTLSFSSCWGLEVKATFLCFLLAVCPRCNHHLHLV